MFKFYLIELFYGLMFTLTIIIVGCAIADIYDYFYQKWSPLESQSGEYGKSKWARKEQNRRTVAKRNEKVAAALKRKEEEKEKARKTVRKTPPLKSQASAQDFIDLSVDVSDWFLNHFGHLWLALREMAEQFHLTVPSIDFTSIPTNFFAHYSMIKESDVGRGFVEILDYVVALGWINKVELKIRGAPIFVTNRLSHKPTFPELMEKVMAFTKLISVRFMAFVSTGQVESFFETEARNAYDKEYTFLTSQKVLIDLGRGNEIDDVTFDRRLQECIFKTESLLNTCAKSERSFYAAKLQVLKNMQSARTLDQKESIREKPYGILLYGGSGVGKSAIANSIIRYVLEVNGKDSSPKAIITLNQEDKFQSEFRTHHKGVLMDDICNASLDRTDGSPVTPIIMFLNQVPMSALNPNAEMKGQVMIEPDVVCATTNVKDLLSNQLSNEPLSINRRFEVTITQKVRPEYRKEGTEMLDNSKIRHMAGDQFPDYATFTVETPRYADNTAGDKFKSGKLRTITYDVLYHNGSPLVDVDIYTLLDYLLINSRDHFAKQKAFVEGQRSLANIKLCEHKRPMGHCSQCALDSQAGVPYFTEVIEYLQSLEERACVWFTSAKRSLITSQYGHFVIAFLMRDVLKNIIMNSIGYYLVAVLVTLVSEILSAQYCAWALVGYTLCYLMYLAVRFYLVRREVVERFSRTTRPSEWLRNMDWQTRRKILSIVAAVGIWKILVKLARKWKTLPTVQAAAPISFTPDAKPYQKEYEFWDVHHREQNYVIGSGGITHSAKSSSPEKLNNIVGKRLMTVVKSDGMQCNALPVKGNVLLIPNHFVKKETQFVRLLKIGGHIIQNLPLSRSVCKQIPGTDLCVWYCPGVGPQKDITDYYPEKIGDGKKIEVYTLYNNDGKLEIYPKMMGMRDRVITTEGGVFNGLKYTFPTETFGGLCMATLIGVTERGIPFIAGHHLAGRGSTGAAGCVSRKQLLETINELDKMPGVLISHSAEPFMTDRLGVDVGPLTAPHEKCPTRGLPATANIRVHGSHNQPRASNNKSAVVTSLISGAVTSIMGIEKQHGPPKDMGARRHKEVDIAAKTTPATMFDADLSQKAFEDYKTRLTGLPMEEIKKVGKISDDVNLAGLDGVLGINAMNFKTSVGFPLKGPKTQYVSKSDRIVEGITCPRDVDPMILDEVERMVDMLKSGKSINAAFKGSLKDEPTKIGKDKVRVFAAADMAFVMLVRRYFLSLAALVQRNKIIFECAVGTVVQSPEWTELFEHIGKNGWDRAIAGDYAKFDGRMSSQFMLMAFRLLIDIAEKSGNYDAEDIKVMRGIATEISYPTYDYFGTLVQFAGSNPSGHPLTVVINSLVNSLYMRYAYYSIARKKGWWKVPPFDKGVSFMTYGDDNIMTVSKGFEDFNHTAIAAELAEVDIKYTMAEKDAESVPFINLSDASFLKHYAVYDDELGLYRAPVEEGSIAKMLHTHLKSDVLSMEQSSAEAIQNVALKYFECGREVYAEKVEQLREVARVTGLSGYVGPIMDYDERLQWYREKFALESQAGNKHKINKCSVNPEEEALQNMCIDEMPIKCTAKEYSFPGGSQGDLLFMNGGHYYIVIEVKCCQNSGHKFRKVRDQIMRYAGAFAALYPTSYVLGLTYTYNGFTEIFRHGEVPDVLLDQQDKFPFDLR